MKIINALEKRISQLSNTSDERVVLEYMKKNIVGFDNRKPTDDVLNDIHNLGLSVTKNWLQQSVIARSRSKGYFIGSCQEGLFLITNEKDWKLAHHFYSKKSKTMLTHCENLEELGDSEGWS